MYASPRKSTPLANRDPPVPAWGMGLSDVARVWLVLLCFASAYQQIRHFELWPALRVSVLSMNLLAVAMLAIGCTTTPVAVPEPEPEPVTWQMVHSYPVRWSMDAAPILVIVDEDARIWHHHVQESAQAWNDQLGFDLWRVADEPTALAGALEHNDTGIVPVLTSSIGKAHTRFAVLPGGKIVGMAILLPDDPDLALYPSARFVVAHELGHAAGLEHDASPTSLMFPRMSIPPREAPTIEHADLDALRAWYGGAR